MNRNKRRAIARTKSFKLHPVVAIHEAGHAVGRIMTAEWMGFASEDAIAVIDTCPGRPSECGDWILMPQATTYGPMYSRAMNDHLIANVDQQVSISRETLLLDVAMCKSAGIDVLDWAKGKAVIAMFGPVAEAIFTGRDVREVVHSPECGNDLSDASRDCSLAGMSEEDAVKVADWAIETATAMLSAANVRRAVKALADSLPSAGCMSGKRAARIINQALAPL
jgi:hypothetical protein